LEGKADQRQNQEGGRSRKLAGACADCSALRSGGIAVYYFINLTRICFQQHTVHAEGRQMDNSDVQGAKNRKKWLNSDKEYAADESKKQNSFSILGWGKGLDWTGTQDPSAGPAAKFGRNYKAPNVRFMKSDEKSTVSKPIKKKKNKLFGIF
jgi:hypothetical protein